jgi:alkylation response protein AidB-like acyl-CoA dehydrogenase
MDAITTSDELIAIRIPAGNDFLPAEEVAALTPAGLTDRVRALQPLIAADAAEAERLRRPTDRVWNALRQSGFFYQFVPKAFGGLESDFDSFIDAGAAIGEVDASTSWAATFCAEHNWIFSHFPLETQREVWGGAFPYIVAPMVSVPPGIATPTEGGYTVKARWKWGTGVMHADWVMGQTLIMREGQPPEPMMVLMPARDVSIADTWQATGMAGTGSHDIIADNVFIPERFGARDLRRGGSEAHERNHPNPIYGAPLLPFLAMSASIPALGATRGMVKLFRERILNSARPGEANKAAEKVSTQIRLAKADIKTRSAEVLIRDAGRRMARFAELAPELRDAERLALRAQLTQAVTLCREAATTLADVAGTSVMLNDNPFQRALRDITVVSTHIVFDPDIALEQHGRGLLGMAPNTPLN